VRPHPRFRDRTVAEVFAEEKERLLALPAVLPVPFATGDGEALVVPPEPGLVVRLRPFGYAWVGCDRPRATLPGARPL
jgi:hypothetical protein